MCVRSPSLRLPRAPALGSPLVALASPALGCDDGPGLRLEAGPAVPDAAAVECDVDPGAPEAIPEPEPFTTRWAREPSIRRGRARSR